MAIVFSDLPPQYKEQILNQYKKQGKQPPPEMLQALNDAPEKQDVSIQESTQALVKRNKYHNKPTKRAAKENAIRFHSSKEARRFDELLLMLKGGAIRKLKLQPQYTLQESFITPEGKRVQAIRYTADFSYEQKVITQGEERWVLVVEDVKVFATRTEQYKTKRKMMLEKFGIEIREI